MSIPSELTAGVATRAAMNVFERYLSVWVLLCIVAGVALGQLLPAAFQVVGRMEIAKVNLPVGLLIWIMIIPMLMKVDFGALHEVRQHARGIGVTLFVNWLVKPFSMAFLGWVFIRHLFAPLLPAAQIDAAFERTYRTLRNRIEAFVALPLADLQRDRGRFKAELDCIGDMSC